MDLLILWSFKLLARLPLAVLHRLGSMLGWLSYQLSRSYARRLRENLQGALRFTNQQAQYPQVLKANISEVGKSLLEMPWVWLRPLTEVVASVQDCQGWQHVEAARALGKGVIVLTPHFGCFELIGLYVAARLPMICLYRRPRYPVLDTLMHQGRERGQMKLAPADLGGVRQLLKALKRGEIIGVLPDQVPSNGEGEWVNFFGRPAYTMTLIARLIESSKAAVVMCHVERMPQGKGYIMRFEPLIFTPDLPVVPQMNNALETVISTCPTQYLWSYNRYKVPHGVTPPAHSKEQA